MRLAAVEAVDRQLLPTLEKCDVFRVGETCGREYSKMAEVDTSVFEIAVGETGKAGPHILFQLDVEIGGASGDEGKASLATLLGRDPELLTPYAIVQGASSEQAAALADGLTSALTLAKSAPPDPTQNALAFVLANAKNSDGDVVTPTISHHGENVAIAFGLQSSLREMVESMATMARMQAGPLLENKSVVRFSLDIGNTFESILNSNNLVLDLFSSLDIKLEVRLQGNTGETVNQLVGAMGLPTPIRAAISAATLFKSAECRAKFASPDQLPESIKSMIPPTEMLTEQKNMVLMMISEADKALVQLFGSHSTGKVTIAVVAPTSFIKVTIGLPGLTKFLS